MTITMIGKKAWMVDGEQEPKVEASPCVNYIQHHPLF